MDFYERRIIFVVKYTIKNEFLKLTVSSKGAEKLSLLSNDIEYLHQPDIFWNRTAPFLFPNVGRLRDNYTFIDKEQYELPQHGFLRDQEFEVLHHTADEISLINIYSEETLKQFPFKYKVIITYTLKQKTLKTNVKIVNEDNKSFGFNVGGHPGFNCPLYANEDFTDYKIVFEKEENFHAPSVESNGTLNFETTTNFKHLKELSLDYKYFLIDAIVIPRVKSKKVLLINKEGNGIEFSYPIFLTLAIWTRPEAKFICLEPWIGYADRSNSNHEFYKKDNIIYLKELEEFDVSYEIKLLN